MTDNQIIEALKYCVKNPYACTDCLYVKNSGPCVTNDPKILFNLINRQKSEIERLNNDLRIWKDIAYRETGYVEIAKADAIKEFADRFHTKLHSFPTGYNSVFGRIFDNLVKEMLEEK